MSRYIDADALKDKLLNAIECGHRVDMPTSELEAVLNDVKTTPSIDIVRCRECKYYDKFPTWSACTYWSGDPYEQASVNDNDFCSYGEREGE